MLLTFNEINIKKNRRRDYFRMQIISNYDIIKEIKNINELQKKVVQLVKLKSSLK